MLAGHKVLKLGSNSHDISVFTWNMLALLQVFASGTGNRRHPLFFLDVLSKRFFSSSKSRQPRASSELQLPTIKSPTAAGSSVKLTADASAAAAAAASAAAAGGVPHSEEPDDVAAERLRVDLIADYQNNPIVVRKLNKTYPGLDGQPPKVGSVSRVLPHVVYISFNQQSRL